jgi:hypothetical protein
MIERIELTQDRYLEAMHLLDFTPEQIEENRRHHGGSLFLSEDVAVACLLNGGVFGVGLSVCPTTGEMILSQVAQDLDALMRTFDDLVNEAYAKFNDPLHNPDHERHDGVPGLPIRPRGGDQRRSGASPRPRRAHLRPGFLKPGVSTIWVCVLDTWTAGHLLERERCPVQDVQGPEPNRPVLDKLDMSRMSKVSRVSKGSPPGMGMG